MTCLYRVGPVDIKATRTTHAAQHAARRRKLSEMAPNEWQNGIRKLTLLKNHAQGRSTRRGPRSLPRYTENGPMNIIDALNDVLIHDASSTPRCNAARIPARPTSFNL